MVKGLRLWAAPFALAAIVAAATQGAPSPVAPRAEAGEGGAAVCSASTAVRKDAVDDGDGGLVAVSGGRLVEVGTGAGTQARLAVPSARGAMIRHVASDPRFGIAYVLDRRGPDTVVIRSGARVVRVPQRSEATHPTWSRRGDLAWSIGTAIAIRSADGRIQTLRGPVARGSVFSPVFRSNRGLVVVAGGPPTRAVPEDERIDQLWTVDRTNGRWRRLTHFRAGSDRWTAIRTPVRTPSGAIEFVRVSGRASATREPSFQLWRLSGSRMHRMHRVRTLPGERYLADYLEGRRVWEVPDMASGIFSLVREGSRGREATLGCGTVKADPLDVADPDRTSRRGRHVPPRGDWPELDDHGSRATEPTYQAAILVGDFGTRASADAVVAVITSAYGAGAPVEVVTASVAPTVIRPGVFGVILRLAPDADLIGSLDAFRTRLPQFATTSWLVAP